MQDNFTRLSDDQDLGAAGTTTSGTLSTAWIDLGSATGRALGGGRNVVARLKCTETFASSTANVTFDFQIVALPKTTIATFTFTAATTDICTATAHGLTNGTRVTVASGTTLPAGLAASTNYYVISATTNTFVLSATPGGTAVNITDTGTGTHTLTWYPEIIASVPLIGMNRMIANESIIELAIPPLQLTPGYPYNRYLFARFVATAVLTAGIVTVDLVDGYSMDGRPTNGIGYTTA